MILMADTIQLSVRPICSILNQQLESYLDIRQILQRTNQSIRMYNKTILLCALFWLILSAQCCLDPAEPTDHCTQCNTTQVLVDARCFDKLKGCLTYKSLNNTSVICSVCQNGYVIVNDHCQRKAIVDLNTSNVTNTTVNDPPPVAVDNPGTLKLNMSTSTTPTVPKPVVSPKPLVVPVLPEPTLVPYINSTNSSISVSDSLYTDFASAIYSKYSRLSNYKPVLQLFNSTSSSQSSQKLLTVFEDGTIINIQSDTCNQDNKAKQQATNANNKDNLRTDNTDSASSSSLRNPSTDSLIVNELYRPFSTTPSDPELTLFARLKQELAKANVQILNRSLSINYEVRFANKTHATINMDLLTGQIRAVSIQNASNSYSVLAKTSETPKYSSYIRWAYVQFLESAKVLNPSESIESTEIQRTENASLIVIKIIYNTTLNDTNASANKSNQYALMKYNIEKNSTEVLGYFIEDSNILNLFKINSTNSTGDKNATNSNLATNSTPNNNNSQKNQGEIKKPVLGATLPTLPSTLNTSPSSTATNPTSIAPTPPSDNVGTSNSKMVSIFTSTADYLTYLTKRQQFATIASRGFKMISVPSAQLLVLTNPILHKLKLMTPAGIYSLIISEVSPTHELSQTYQLESPEACLVFSTTDIDPVVSKLDAYLKKTYAILQSYPRMVSMNGLTESAQKYYIVYANEGLKKIMFQVTKKRNLSSYAISRSQVYNSGYFFPTKGHEAINLNLWEYDDQSFYSDYQSFRMLKPLLNELLTRYKTYVLNSTLVSAIANATHAKMYLSNKFATFEFTARLDSQTKGEFILLQQKLGKDVLPTGFKKDCLVKSEQNADLKVIEDQLVKKYRTYFGGGGLELYSQKCQSSLIPSVNCFDVAFKTVLGYFTLTANQSPDSLQLSALKRVNSVVQQSQTTPCKAGQSMDANDKKCYQTIKGCYLQIGSICVMCDIQYIAAGRKQCKKVCAW